MVYDTSHIKRRRATKAEMEARAEALIDIVLEISPCTVRQVFYQATVRGVIEKTEAGYGKVQRLLVQLRRDGQIDYSDIADNTRWMRKPTTWYSLKGAVEQTAATYRKALWDKTPDYVEIWLEKDALSGVIWPVTQKYDVPLMVSRGYASLSFLASAAEAMECEYRPCHIYHLGDWDPSGQDAARHIEETLRDLAPTAEIHFKRIAVVPTQISYYDLPGRPTKKTDTRSKNWHGDSVELDAINPNVLRGLVEQVLEEHLPDEEFAVLKAAEKSERELLRAWADAYEVPE
jgi:methylphosphotriester-DNA--protein-cysteine methyltransferase